MSKLIALLKAIFGIKHKLTPREMAEEQIRAIEKAIMEYNSKDRVLRRDKDDAIRAGREADTKLKEVQKEIDSLQSDDDFRRDELASCEAELTMEVEKARTKMDIADGNIFQNKKLLDGAEKTLLRLRGALETGIPPEELLKMVKDVADMGNRYDLAVNTVEDEISTLSGQGAEDARRMREEMKEKSAVRRGRAVGAAQASDGSQSADTRVHVQRQMSADQH